MPGPFSLLAALPWSTILRQTPAVLAAAEAVFANSRRQQSAQQSTDRSRNDIDALRVRVTELEDQLAAHAELIKQLATQTSALATVAQESLVRVRQALIVALVAVGFGVAACVIAFVV